MPDLSSKPVHNLITLFTPQELEEFYGIPSFNEESRAQYFTLSDADKKLMEIFKSDRTKIYFLLTLGYFRAKGCFVEFTIQSVLLDLQYVAEMYFKGEKISKKLPDFRQRNRIQQKILDHEKSLRWTSQVYQELKPLLSQLVQRHPKARPLTKAFLDHLSRRKITLPAYSSLQRVITDTLSLERQRLLHLCKKGLKAQDQLFIQNLLKEESSFSPLAVIKHDVKDFSYTELCKEVKKQESLKALFQVALPLLSKSVLPKKTIEYYGSLVNFYSLYKLKRMPKHQAHWYLLCYSFIRYQKVNDNLVQFFKHYVTTFDEESKKYGEEKLQEELLKMEALLVKTGKFLQLFTTNQEVNVVEKQAAFRVLPKDKMMKVEQFLLGYTRDEKLFYWEHVDSLKQRIQMHLKALFLAIDFSTVKEIDPFFSGMKLLSEGTPFATESLHQLIPRKDRAYLMKEDKSLNQERCAFFFYKRIAYHIETQKITLTYSQKYKSLKEEMISTLTWEKDKSQILKGFGYPKLMTPIEQLLLDYKQELNPLLESVNERIKSGENAHIKVKAVAEGVHWSLPYQKKKEIINNPFFLQLPQINIVDILYFVHQECRFLECFTPVGPFS